MQPNAFWAPRGLLMRSKGPSQALRRQNSTENTKSSVLHKGKPTFHCDQSFHFAPHFVTLRTQISSRTAFESSLRLPVSIGAFVKTIANDGPNAQCQPLAHSMRPNLPNISRFHSIARVQSYAKGLCCRFLVSERFFATFCHPQTVESPLDFCSSSPSHRGR